MGRSQLHCGSRATLHLRRARPKSSVSRPLLSMVLSLWSPLTTAQIALRHRGMQVLVRGHESPRKHGEGVSMRCDGDSENKTIHGP